VSGRSPDQLAREVREVLMRGENDASYNAAVIQEAINRLSAANQRGDAMSAVRGERTKGADVSEDLKEALASLEEAIVGKTSTARKLHAETSSGGGVILAEDTAPGSYRGFVKAEDGRVVIFDSCDNGETRGDYAEFDPIEFAKAVIPAIREALS